MSERRPIIPHSPLRDFLRQTDHLYFLTGNKGKAREVERNIQRISPGLGISNYSLDQEFDELQGVDPIRIARFKAREGYKIVGEPTLVEDTLYGYDELGGYPGTQIKWIFAYPALGNEFLCEIGNRTEGRKVTVSTVFAIAGLDEEDIFTFSGDVHGVAPDSPEWEGEEGEDWFDWDASFIPDGQRDGTKKTYAQMTPQGKDSLSMRTKALNRFLEFMADLRAAA